MIEEKGGQRKKRGREEKPRVRHRAVGLPNVELERLEAAAYRGASGAFPSRTLLADQDIYTRLTETANALGACIRLPQQRDALACGAVDLRVLGRVARGRIR